MKSKRGKEEDVQGATTVQQAALQEVAREGARHSHGQAQKHESAGEGSDSQRVQPLAHQTKAYPASRR